jgi:hypothetical protein
MADSTDPKGTSLPDGFDNERRRNLWKKLRKLQGELPLDWKVSWWKREYRADLVQQLRDIETGNLPIGMWHLIGAIPGAVEPDEPGYRIDERFAEWLVEATSEDVDAHNLACELVAANLKADLVIPASLRSFGADVLVGITSKPKKPQGRPQTNWYRDFVIVDAIERARLMGIKPTRNETTDPEIYCGVSLVHEAVAEVWVDEISYERVRQIWTERKKFEASVARLQLAIGNLQQDPED